MKLIILRGKYTNHFFGIQLICGKYTVQIAYWKFGVYNSYVNTWWPS